MDAANVEDAEAMIPPRLNRKVVIFFDSNIYKERNFIARMFNKIKHFQRIATRYDKTASAYLGFVWVARLYLWLK